MTEFEYIETLEENVYYWIMATQDPCLSISTNELIWNFTFNTACDEPSGWGDAKYEELLIAYGQPPF